MTETQEVVFDYIKSNQFRVVHADGAIGGPTPTGFIQINLWSQRHPIPRQIVNELNGGRVGKELRRTQREAIVREIEFGAIVDVSTAKQLRDWLDEQIKAVADGRSKAAEARA